MRDVHHRTIDYLRVSVTDRCNMRCLYCMPKEGIPIKPSAEILTYEEILFIVKAGLPLGINKLRITGGEPLVRKGLMGFIKNLSILPGLKDLSMTTNGYFLKDRAKDLFDAGVTRLNISLDTLSRETYKVLTRVDGLPLVFEGIEKALQLGFSPIKINVVILKGFNEDQIPAFLCLSRDYPLEVRFIEWMPLGGREGERDFYVSNRHIKKRIQAREELFPVKGKGYGPAEVFTFKGAKGKIGFISPFSCNFCQSCNRLRLTSEGRIRPCLARDLEFDLKSLIRGGASLSDLSRELKGILQQKPIGHQFYSTKVTKSMFKIGG